MGANFRLLSDNCHSCLNERYFICTRRFDRKLLFWNKSQCRWQPQTPKQYYRYIATAYNDLELFNKSSVFVAHFDGSKVACRHPTGAKLFLVSEPKYKYNK
jgi:hypothetical protein